MQGCKCVHVNRMCAYTHALEQNERIVKRASILHLFFLFIFSCYLVLLFFFSSLFSFFLVAFHHLFVVVSSSYSSSFCIPYPYCRQGVVVEEWGSKESQFRLDTLVVARECVVFDKNTMHRLATFNVTPRIHPSPPFLCGGWGLWHGRGCPLPCAPAPQGYQQSDLPPMRGCLSHPPCLTWSFCFPLTCLTAEISLFLFFFPFVYDSKVDKAQKVLVLCNHSRLPLPRGYLADHQTVCFPPFNLGKRIDEQFGGPFIASTRLHWLGCGSNKLL